MPRFWTMAFVLFVSSVCGAQVAVLPVAPSKLSITFRQSAPTVVVLRIADSNISKGHSTDVEDISVRVIVDFPIDPIIVNAPRGSFDGSRGWVSNTPIKAMYRGARQRPNDFEMLSLAVKPGVGLAALARGTLTELPENPLRGGGIGIRAEVEAGESRSVHCGRFSSSQCRFRVDHRRHRAKLACRDGEPTQECGCAGVADCIEGDGCCPMGCGPLVDGDCARCFVDAGETVIDECHDLEWEKKTGVDLGEDLPGLGIPSLSDSHDVDNLYTWSGMCDRNRARFCQPDSRAADTCARQTGRAFGCEVCSWNDGVCLVDARGRGSMTTIWSWLNRINDAAFGGHRDWRIPTSPGYPDFPRTDDAPELETFIGQCKHAPVMLACVSPVAGPIPYWWTWSGSTMANGPDGSWPIADTGSYSSASKVNALSVRAVRSRAADE